MWDIHLKKKDCFLLENSQVHKNASLQHCCSCGHSSEGLQSYESYEHQAEHVQILKSKRSRRENVFAFLKTAFCYPNWFWPFFSSKIDFVAKGKCSKTKFQMLLTMIIMIMMKLTTFVTALFFHCMLKKSKLNRQHLL